jgi:uncharacterized protein involved in type VI secretion and phage assembly
MAILPEVGDEVLVAFGLGHVDEPYVLGGLYNGVDRPQGTDHVGTTDGRVQRRVLASRTGMLVEMVEKPGEERLTISTHRGGQQVTLTQSGDGGVQIVAKGSVTVHADKDVTVEAGQKLTLTAGSELDLSAQLINIQGGLVKIN